MLKEAVYGDQILQKNLDLKLLILVNGLGNHQMAIIFGK